MSVAYDALADRQAGTLSQTNAFCGEKRLEDVREILGWDPGAVVRDFHDRLVVVAPRSDVQVAIAVHGIRGIIEQVHPHLREFARIAPDTTGFARKILGDAKVVELVI